MRRILLLTIPLFLLPSLFPGTAAAQGPQGSTLPTPADYPSAGAACKNKDKLIVKVTSSYVDFPDTVECELLIHATCGGEIKKYKSGVRPSRTGVFDDYWAAAAALQGREICCDQRSPEEKRNDKESSSAPQAGAPLPPSAPQAPAPARAPVPRATAPAAQPAPQATQAKLVPVSSYGEKPGSRVEIQELKRVSGGTVMLKFTLINDSDARFNFGHDLVQQGTNDFANISGVHLLDPVSKKKYLVVRDSQNRCDCSGKLKDVPPKSRVNLWARFPAPPDNVEKIVVVVPHFSPMDDVPLGR